MEEWQIALIRKNLTKLIATTTCNVSLLTKLHENEILANEDIEDLKSQPTAYTKSEKLYAVLQTRRNAFIILVGALRELNQSGAVNILCINEFGLITVNFNEVLGKGKNGTVVYKGKFDGREVAVKVVKAEREQVQPEIDILKSLDQHENIVRYFWAEMQEERSFIAMELCLINLEEETYKRVLNLDSKCVLEKCTRGVAFLHEKGIMHGDLKPANILLNQLGQVKLCDFGYSNILEVGVSVTRIESTNSEMFGTMDWMAPEILKHLGTDTVAYDLEINRTNKEDIFALGCIFYFVLTKGKHLFGQRVDRPSRIVRNKPKWEYEHADDQTKLFVLKMVSHDPNSRPSSEEVLSSVLFNSKPNCLTATLNTEEVVTQMVVSDLCAINQNLPVYNLRSCNQFAPTETGENAFPSDNIDQTPGGINATDDKGNTLLHLAVQKHVPVAYMILLVEFGIDWNAVNKDGKTAIHLASAEGYPNAVEYLASLGSDINAQTYNQETPLHQLRFAKQNLIETLNVLLKTGADINAYDRYERYIVELSFLEGRSGKELYEIVKSIISFKDERSNSN